MPPNGSSRIRRRHAVDEDRAGLDLARRSAALGGVVRPGVAPRPKGVALASSDRLVVGRDPEHRRHRAEHLLGVDRACRGHVREHRRRVEPARPLRGRCRRSRIERTLGGGVRDRAPRTSSRPRLGRQRTDIGRLVDRIADAQRLHAARRTARRTRPRSLACTMNRFAAMHDCPLFWHARVHRDLGTRGVEVGGRHHDERVAAAELEHRLLDLVAAIARDRLRRPRSLPVSVTARDPRVVEDRARPARAPMSSVWKAPSGKPARGTRPRWPARTAARSRRA